MGFITVHMHSNSDIFHEIGPNYILDESWASTDSDTLKHIILGQNPLKKTLKNNLRNFPFSFNNQKWKLTFVIFVHKSESDLIKLP